ncbi:MAG: GNAT family N-acetyltransferase [bacterium]
MEINGETGFPPHDVNDYITPMMFSGDATKSTYVLQVNGVVVGKADIVMDCRRGVAYIVVLAIHPDFQGRGYGERLLREVIELCRREDEILYLELHTIEDNKRALKLYKKVGFFKRHNDVHLRMILR